MFVELTKEKYEQLAKMLREMGIAFEASDCTLPGESVRMVHVEIPGELRKEQIDLINDTFGKDAMFTDRNGDGRADYLGEGIPEYRERRHRPWDDKVHTLKQEIWGYVSGKNTEETVTYERE